MGLTTNETQLNKALSLVSAANGSYTLQSAITDHLPGQPRILLNDRNELISYVRQAIVPRSLEKVAPHLWLIATPDHAHVSALHHQSARDRSIVVVENPHLHLVWYYDRVFVKPLPPYLLSHAFWTYIEGQDREVWLAAAGFLRTYSYLIQYEIDFRKAQSQELGLIPLDDGQDPITFERFTKFISPFASLGNESASLRYHYGELRLTRLNWMARIFLRKLTFHHINAQWMSYISIFVAPFLTVFLILSTALSAMQVELAVQDLDGPSTGIWSAFSRASRVFSIGVLLLVALVLFMMVTVAMFAVIHEQLFAWRLLRHKNRKEAFEKSKSAVV